ncbi:MAG: preprotein translocase subunit YajC [Phycisphaerae bacterium]|nr:preprotein translocase subunit YajC [Phycisphaerae bacterium]MDD5381195.1 preprotein translocase subunit YajC [Phycisphaerae bacterium]
MNNLWILANVEGNEAPLGGITSEPETEASTKIPSDSDAVATKGTEQKPFGNMVWVIWIALMLVMFFVVFRGPQKQKQERKKLIQSLQKNDRVQTIGGIFGTVVDIKGDEITLKVDESNNTKIKVASSAIGRNLSQDKS